MLEIEVDVESQLHVHGVSFMHTHIEQSVVEKFSSFFNPLGTYHAELHSQTRLRGKSLSTK